MSLFKRTTKSTEDKKKVTDKPVTEKKKSEEVGVIGKKTAVKGSHKKNEARQSSGSAYKVLLHPLITEKISWQNALNQYTFVVDRRANKIEIKKAIRQLYGVTPLKVRIINVTGKLVPSGRGRYTRRKSWKKAIITLPAGKKIDVYEGI